MGELKDLCIRLKTCGLTRVDPSSTYKGFDELTVRKLAYMKPDFWNPEVPIFHGANKPDIRLGTGMGNLMIGL